MKTQPRVLFVGPMLGCHPGWVPNPAELLAPKFNLEGYTCFLTSHTLNRYARLIDIIRALVSQRLQYDIVSIQVYSGTSFIVEDIVSQIALILGKKIVMVMHGGGMPEFMKRFPVWSRCVLRRANLMVTPSTYLQETLLFHGFEARVIPNMLEIEKYPFRLRENIKPRMIWMRTFYNYCHPEFAVEVVERLFARYPDASLTMSGQDKGLLEPTMKLVSKKGLGNHVRFAGFLNAQQKKIEFESHDIYLNTNSVDNMPIAVVEAAAFGLPVVAMAVGGIPHLLKDQDTGLLTPFGDVDAMVRAVCRLIEEPNLAANISRQGRVLAQKFSWENVFPLWNDVYHHVLGES